MKGFEEQVETVGILIKVASTAMAERAASTGDPELIGPLATTLQTEMIFFFMKKQTELLREIRDLIAEQEVTHA